MTIFLAFAAGVVFGAVAMIGVGLWLVCRVPHEHLEIKEVQKNRFANTGKITLDLGPYWAANLRWLLHMASLSPQEVEQYKHDVPHWMGEVSGLCTGDWNGEVLYELEQKMIDADMSTDANMPSPWPMQGWLNGEKSPK